MGWTQEVYCLVFLDHRHTGAPLTYSFEMKKKVIWGWISGRKLKTRGNKLWEWNSRSSPFPAGTEIHLGFIFIKASQFLQVGQECKKCLLSPFRVALSDSTKVTNCLGTQKTKFPRKHPQGLGETQFLPYGGSCDLSEDILQQGELKSLAAINLGLLSSSLLPTEIQSLSLQASQRHPHPQPPIPTSAPQALTLPPDTFFPLFFFLFPGRL